VFPWTTQAPRKRAVHLFDKDHVVGVQYVTSPQHTDRVKVFGASYKIPFYTHSSSLEFFGGYSNVNAVVGGLTNFQGGGKLLSARYNMMLQRRGVFDPRLTFGLDWRDFRRIEFGTPPTVLYNEIVVTPVSITYMTTGKFTRSDVNLNLTALANIPSASKGKKEDFAAYDLVNLTDPNPSYKIIKYGASYAHLVGSDWQLRAALNGQHSSDVLIQGEQIRLGGADGVRGFSEGSEGGDSGLRMNVEAYSPNFGSSDLMARALVFYDMGKASSNIPGSTVSTSIAGAGFGFRVNKGDRYALRVDFAKITKEGNDPQQMKGDGRVHASFNANF